MRAISRPYKLAYAYQAVPGSGSGKIGEPVAGAIVDITGRAVKKVYGSNYGLWLWDSFTCNLVGCSKEAKDRIKRVDDEIERTRPIGPPREGKAQANPERTGPGQFILPIQAILGTLFPPAYGAVAPKGCGCRTKPSCNSSATTGCKSCCCSAQCAKLANGRGMSPRVSGNRCFCNFRSSSGGGSGSGSAVSGCGCKTNTGCNSMSSSSCKSCCCSSQCRKLANGRKMNPRVSGNRCFCNFSSASGGGGGGGGGSSTGGYVSGCGCRSTPRCNSVGGYNSCLSCCCSNQCSRIRNGRNMNPRVSGRTCYCNFSGGGGSSSSGGSGSSGGFKCPYSGCGSTTSKSQCFLCRCRGICNSAKCGGVRTVKSDGSCFCNKSC